MFHPRQIPCLGRKPFKQKSYTPNIYLPAAGATFWIFQTPFHKNKSASYHDKTAFRFNEIYCLIIRVFARRGFVEKELLSGKSCKCSGTKKRSTLSSTPKQEKKNFKKFSLFHNYLLALSAFGGAYPHHIHAGLNSA